MLGRECISCLCVCRTHSCFRCFFLFLFFTFYYLNCTGSPQAGRQGQISDGGRGKGAVPFPSQSRRFSVPLFFPPSSLTRSPSTTYPAASSWLLSPRGPRLRFLLMEATAGSRLAPAGTKIGLACPSVASFTARPPGTCFFCSVGVLCSFFCLFVSLEPRVPPRADVIFSRSIASLFLESARPCLQQSPSMPQSTSSGRG